MNPDNSIEYHNYGNTFIGSEKKVDENTVFEIGSITKTFTALLLKKYLSNDELNNSVSMYLDTINNRALDSVSIYQLLNHTSGFPRLPVNFNTDDWSNPFSDYSSERLSNDLEHVQPMHLGIWSYSNFGYATLGRIIKSKTHNNTQNLFNEIFEDAGMKNTSINRHDFNENIATPYFCGIKVAYWDNIDESGYIGGIKTSSSSLMSYLAYQKKHNPLFSSDNRVTNAFKTGIKLFGPDELHYKNGWFVLTPNDSTEIILHNGGTGGFTSFIAYNKSGKKGVVVLSSGGMELIDDIGLKIIDPSFILKKPQQELAFKIANLFEQQKADSVFEFYQGNKEQKTYKFDVKNLYELQHFYFGQKQYKNSTIICDIFISEYPDDWEAYFLKAQNEERLGNIDDALGFYEKAYSLNNETVNLMKIKERIEN